MLYKKNREQSLSDELFQNPTAEYRGTPFWAWNNKFDDKILKEQIEIFKEMGFGGFHMHSRSGMSMEYLGEGFMNCVKYCVGKAKEEDMLAWLYDEDKWPSGFAGGLVTKTPKYRGKIILFTKENLEDVPKEQAIEEGLPYFYAAYDVVLDDRGFLKSCREVGRGEECANKYYAFVKTLDPTPWFNNQTYLDTLSYEAVAKFIEVTHEAYKNAVGSEFGKTVPAIFTDEPEYGRVIPKPFSNGDTAAQIPWTTDFDVNLKHETGLDIRPVLPELFFALEDNAPSYVKYVYYRCLTNRLADCFYGQIGRWCEKNGLMLTGHSNTEDTMQLQLWCCGDVMRLYPHMQLPGIDTLVNGDREITAKQAQSVVHQYGKEGVMSELYGVTNWDFDFRGHKFQGDWEAALGVTVRVPHLSWLTMEGTAKRDYPASIFYQSPWYKEYKLIEDHFSRVNTALTRGEPDVSVGVIHPIESMWMQFGPNDTCGGMIDSLDSQLAFVSKFLLHRLIDFDYIDEGNLEDLCTKGGNPLVVGKMSYSTIVVPNCVTLRKNTIDRLTEFCQNGGKLIFTGKCPEFVDAKSSHLAKPLYEMATKVPMDQYALTNAISDRQLEIYMGNGQKSDRFIYQMRKDADGKWLFIANSQIFMETGSVKPHSLDIYDNWQNASYLSVAGSSSAVFTEDDIQIVINGEFTPVLYDTMTGETKEPNFEIKDGKTVIKTKYYWGNSYLFKLLKKTKEKAQREEPKKTVSRRIDFKEAVDYKLVEPNVLLLDIAEYAFDDGEWNEKEEVLKISDMFRASLGWQVDFPQPWVIADEPAEHFVHLKYRFHSEVELSGCKLALEQAESTKILFNGEAVQSNIDGWYVDQFIKTVPLPDVKKGENVLELTVPYSKRGTVEACYLLGDFFVRLAGTESTLIPPRERLAFMSTDKQDLPFYSGNIIYKTEICVEDCDLEISATSFRGALVKVYLDGKEAGISALPPYIVEFKNVAKGKHTVEFELFGNRYNTFAPLHLADETETWIGPNAWSARGNAWCYEYRTRPFGILKSPVIKVISK